MSIEVTLAEEVAAKLHALTAERDAALVAQVQAVLVARNLRAALQELVDVFVNPGDDGEFEDGEVPVLDRARAALQGAEA
jgi:hypothetical protein